MDAKKVQNVFVAFLYVLTEDSKEIHCFKSHAFFLFNYLQVPCIWLQTRHYILLSCTYPVLLQAGFHPFTSLYGFGGTAQDLSLIFNNIIFFGRHKLAKLDMWYLITYWPLSIILMPPVSSSAAGRVQTTLLPGVQYPFKSNLSAFNLEKGGGTLMCFVLFLLKCKLIMPCQAKGIF